MAVSVFTKSGAKATSKVLLSKDIFSVSPKNHELLKAAYVSYLGNSRENAAQTKTRGEVSGGGKKPWKQKGTGRARFGSSRNPIWRGGGVAFGPTGNENYVKKLSISSKRLAIRQALSLKTDVGGLIIIETFECKEGKIKPTIKFLDKIGAKGSILLAVSVKDSLVVRATNNLPNVKAVQATYLNVFDILNADTIIISQKALELIQNWLALPVAKPSMKLTKDDN